MSNKPRIAFVRFARRDASKLDLWRAHGLRVSGVSTPIVEASSEQPDASVVTWNLMSTNNRVLARSAHLYGSLADAIQGAALLTTEVAQIKVAFITDSLRGQYGWHGSVAGNPALTCDRWHATERDRRSSAELALVTLVVAELGTEARLIDMSLTGRS